MATTHDVTPPGIRFHNLLPPRQRNGNTRHTLSLQSLARPRPSTGYRYPSCPHHTGLQGSLPTSLLNDPEMQALADLIITGWPEDIKEVPRPLHPYWQHRETPTVEDGLVLRGEALIIPPAERERTLHQLHQFPPGNNKVTVARMWKFLLAQHHKAIEEVVHQCKT